MSIFDMDKEGIDHKTESHTEDNMEEMIVIEAEIGLVTTEMIFMMIGSKVDVKVMEEGD